VSGFHNLSADSLRFFHERVPTRCSFPLRCEFDPVQPVLHDALEAELDGAQLFSESKEARI
jgi:hypothetical protein